MGKWRGQVESVGWWKRVTTDCKGHYNTITISLSLYLVCSFIHSLLSFFLYCVCVVLLCAVFCCWCSSILLLRLTQTQCEL